MNLYEKINKRDYKSIRDSLYEEQTRIENEIFICSIGLFCQQIENFKNTYPDINEVKLGFEYSGDDKHLSIKTKNIKTQWEAVVNNYLDDSESSRVELNIGHHDFILNLDNYDKNNFRDKLIGPDLAHYLLMQKMQSQLEDKPDIKKPKI